MKAISVQQPWAWAIAAGFKTVENRKRMQGWRSVQGQTIALHAGQRWSRVGASFDPLWEAYRDRTGLTPPLKDDHPIVRGATIALIDVVDVHFDRGIPAGGGGGCCPGPWAERSYTEHGQPVNVVHLVVANPRPLPTPIRCRGQLGLFTAPVELAEVPGELPR